MKRVFSLFLALVIVFGLLPLTALAGELNNGLQYEVYGSHVEITGYTGDATEVTIPAEIEGLPVTVIGEWAFSYCSSLTNISIPDSVTFIDRYAFTSCNSLTSISISANVSGIGISAFNYCPNLIKIDVDAQNAYYSSDDRGVLFDKEKSELIQAPGTIIGPYTIPDSVTKIGLSAFGLCANLTDITIPDSVTYIDDYAFTLCSGLTNISIPDSVTHIGSAVFSSCSNLTRINVGEHNSNYSSDDRGVLFDKEKSELIQAPGAIIDSYTIPDGVTKIGLSAFDGCSSLTNITIPNSLTHIGGAAFSKCSRLSCITIPSSITSIGSFAFDFCSNLTRICFEGNAPYFAKNAFAYFTTNAYYPSDNPTWTKDVLQDYGGTITWIPYNPDNPFSDVPVGSFYEEPVLWALEHGITTGAAEDAFDPNGKCLRAHVVTFLHRAAENPEPAATKNPFTDVKATDFFYKPVLWAVEQKITNGISADKFGSYDVCNRAAVVTFLWRAAGSPEPASDHNPFKDVKTTDFFYKPVLWAVENGITNGLTATEFGPTSPCNRAQVVTFLYRAYND